MQLNFAALALVVPIAAVIAYRARLFHWRGFALGTGATVILLAPWLAHDAKHGFKDFIALAEEGRGHGPSVPGAGTVAAIRQTADLVGVGDWGFVTGSSQHLFARDAGAWWALAYAAGIAAVVLLVLGFVTSAARIGRNTRRVSGWPGIEFTSGAGPRALLLVWLAGVWLSYVASARGKVAPHYMIVTYPVTFVLISLSLSDMVRDAPRSLVRSARVGSIAVVTTMMVAFAAFALSFQRFVARHGGTSGDYGVIYRDKSELAARVRARRLNVDDPVLQFLVGGSLGLQPGRRGLVTTRDRLTGGIPLSCVGAREHFGALEACFPVAVR